MDSDGHFFLKYFSKYVFVRKLSLKSSAFFWQAFSEFIALCYDIPYFFYIAVVKTSCCFILSSEYKLDVNMIGDTMESMLSCCCLYVDYTFFFVEIIDKEDVQKELSVLSM